MIDDDNDDDDDDDDDDEADSGLETEQNYSRDHSELHKVSDIA